MLKTALIGITGYGREHLRLLLYGYEKGIMRPSAAVVINPEVCLDSVNLLEGLGCRIFSSVDAMWEAMSGAIDLCMIPSSICTHFPFATQAIENGAHVFVEKPICGCIQEALELTALAESREREICVGFQDIYNPQVRRIKEQIHAGAFGQLLRLKGWGSWPRPVSYYKRNDWAGKAKLESGWVLDTPVSNAMAHFLFLMLYWAGKDVVSFGIPGSLKADLFRAQDIDTFDTASMRIEVEDGPSVFYAVSHSVDETVQPLLRGEGEAGWFEFTHCGKLRGETREGSFEEDVMDLSIVRETMIESVCNWLSERSGHVALGQDAIQHVRIANALHEAAPVLAFPEERIRQRYAGDNKWIFVDNLVSDLRQAFEQGSLLSEIWLQNGNRAPDPATPFPLHDYRCFNGVNSDSSISFAHS